MVTQINLKGAGVQVGNFWSLEELQLSASAIGTIAVALFQVANIGSPLPSLPVRNYSIPLTANDANGEFNSGLVTPRLFLGRANEPSGAGSLSFALDNTNLATLDVTVRGYMWTARSILANGGIRRPMSGFFPN